MTECTQHCVVLQNGRTAMMLAAVNGHWGVVEKLLAAGGDVHAKDNVSCCVEGDEEAHLNTHTHTHTISVAEWDEALEHNVCVTLGPRMIT